MVFGLFILILAAAVAFFHYVQGFFSSMISMIIVILSAALALGFHENLAGLLFVSFAPAQGYAISLVLLFGVIYVVLRVLFDKLVPGNIQVPVIADKVGAGVFGVVAGIFASGVLAIAAQALPFGPTIGGYSRFALQDRQAQGVKVTGKAQLQDIPILEELKLDELSATDVNTLFAADSPRSAPLLKLLPVDQWTVGLVSHLSDGGSLAGDRSFASIHPAYLNELFAQRLGIQLGAARVIPGQDPLKVEKAIASIQFQSTLSIGDLEMPEIRGKGRLAPTQMPAGDLLIIRVRPSASGADSDGFIRFSPASVRLVGKDGVTYHPIGTVSGRMIARNLPDDPLFLKSGKAVDLVFCVDSEKLAGGHGPLWSPNQKFADGTFIEMKRLARADLSGKPIENTNIVEASENVGVLTREAAK